MKLEHLQRRKLPFFFFRCSFPYCICSPLRLFNHYYKVDFSSNEKSSHEGNLRGASKILRADHTNFEALKKGEEKRSPKGSYSLFLFWCQVIWIKEGREANMFCCKNLVAKTTRLVMSERPASIYLGNDFWRVSLTNCVHYLLRHQHSVDACQW